MLTLSDVGVKGEPTSSNTHINGTFAVPVDYEHWEVRFPGSARTQVYKTINKTLTRWLYDHCTKEFEEMFDPIRSITPSVLILTPEEAAFWGAEESMVYFHTGNNAADLLLLKGNMILRLTVEGEDMNLETVADVVKEIWSEWE